MSSKSATASAASTYPEGSKSRKRGGPGLFVERDTEDALEIWLDASLPKRAELLSLIEGEGGEIKPDHGSPGVQLIILSPRSVNVFDSYCHPSWLPADLRARKERQRAALREAAANAPSSSKPTTVLVGDDEDIWKRKVLLKESWVKACIASKKLLGEREDWGGFRAGGPPRVTPARPTVVLPISSQATVDVSMTAEASFSVHAPIAKDGRHDSDSPEPSESELMEVEVLASKRPNPVPPAAPEEPSEEVLGPEPITVEEAYVDIYPELAPMADKDTSAAESGVLGTKKKRKRPSSESTDTSIGASSNGESSTKRTKTDPPLLGNGPNKMKMKTLCAIMRKESEPKKIPVTFAMHAEMLANKFKQFTADQWQDILHEWEYKTGRFDHVDDNGYFKPNQKRRPANDNTQTKSRSAEAPATSASQGTLAPPAASAPSTSQHATNKQPLAPPPLEPAAEGSSSRNHSLSVDLLRSPEKTTGALTAEEEEAKKARTTEKIRRVLVREVEKWAPKEIDGAFFAHLAEAYDKYSAKWWHKYHHEWTTSTGKFSGAGPSRRDSGTTTATAEPDARESPAIAGPSRPTPLPNLGTQPPASQATPKESQSQTTPRKHHAIQMEAQPLFMAPIITQPSPVKRSSTAASDRTSPSAKTKVAPALTSKALVEIFEAAVRDHPDDDAEEISMRLLAEHGTLSSGFSWKTYFEDWQHKRNRFAFLAGNGRGPPTLSPIQASAPLVNLEPSQGTGSHHSEKVPVEQLDRIFQSQQPLLDAGHPVAAIVRSLISSYGQYSQVHWENLYRDWRNKTGRFARLHSTASPNPAGEPLAADGSNIVAAVPSASGIPKGAPPRMSLDERADILQRFNEQYPELSNKELGNRLEEAYPAYTSGTWGIMMGEFRRAQGNPSVRGAPRISIEQRADILQRFHGQYPHHSVSELGRFLAEEHPEYAAGTWASLMGEFRRAQLDGLFVPSELPEAASPGAGSAAGSEVADLKVYPTGKSYAEAEELAMAAHIFGRLPALTTFRLADWEDVHRRYPSRSVASYAQHYRAYKDRIDNLVRQMGGIIPDLPAVHRARAGSDDSVVYVEPPEESEEEHEVIEVLSDSDLDL